MRRRIIQSFCVLLLAATMLPLRAGKVVVTVENNDGIQRHELLEVAIDSVRGVGALDVSAPFLVKNELGEELPYQVTYDGRLLVEVSVRPYGKTRFWIENGTPGPMSTYACGRVYPMRKDDLAWENDRGAYRIYGPALQRTGEKSFGIDVWVKNVPYPVVQGRYERYYQGRVLKDSLKRAGMDALADSVDVATSFHFDHGEGMDGYAVGATLGCGAPALVKDGEMIFPYCYEGCRILDNGPLRFTVELDYPCNADGVVEHRRISLDKGSHFNRMTVWYDNIRSPLELAAGVVLHGTGEMELAADYVCYADPTDRPDLHNSQVYVGVLFPDGVDKTYVTADGSHALGGVTGYEGGEYTYYFGSAWSGYDIRGVAQWRIEIESFMRRRRSPLSVTVSAE